MERERYGPASVRAVVARAGRALDLRVRRASVAKRARLPAILVLLLLVGPGAELARGTALAAPAPSSAVGALSHLVAPPVASSQEVANFSASSIVVSDPSQPGRLWAFGSFEGDAVGANLTNAQAFPNGTVASFVSSDGGNDWTSALLPGTPAYFDPHAGLCGFRNDAALGASVSRGTLVVLVASVPRTDSTSCSVAPSGWGLLLFVSVDGAATWQKPRLLAYEPAAPSVGPSQHSEDVALAPNGSVYVAYPDAVNGSLVLVSTGTSGDSPISPPVALLHTRAGVRLATAPTTGLPEVLTWFQTEPGTSGNQFTAVYQVNCFEYPSASSDPVNVSVGTFTSLSFLPFPLADMISDSSAGSPFEGRLYAVWSNGTTLSNGVPAIVLSESTDLGATWSAPTNLSGAASALECCAAVSAGGNGSVIVAWFGLTGVTFPHYRVSATVSFDGGQHFSPEFGVDGWTGNGTNSLTPPALAARGDSVDVLWTQYHSATPIPCTACPGGVAPDRQLDHATVVDGTISSTAATTLSVSGIATAGTTLDVGPVPVGVAGVGGQPFTVIAPASFTDGGTTEYFAEWFGSGDSSSPEFTSTWEVGTRLTACFVGAQGDACHAPGAPGTLQVNVTPAQATVIADGRPVPIHSGHGSLQLYPGLRPVSASAPAYTTVTTTVEITEGNTTYLNLVLALAPGLLEGNVTPNTARVTVDGAWIAVDALGNFSTSLSPGTHTLAASEYGYVTYSAPVTITFGPPTIVALVLAAIPVHISGALSPANATLLVDGSRVNVSPLGGFALSLIAGAHTFGATAWRYLPFFEVLVFAPNEYVPLGIVLTRANGSLEAQVLPAVATVTLDGVVVPTVAGALRAQLPWGNHQLAASARGYTPALTVVNVPFGAVAFANLSLAIAPGWIAGAVRPTGAGLSIDGVAANVSTDGIFNVSIAAGPHLLAAVAAGFLNLTVLVIVAPGETNRTDLELLSEPSPSLPSEPALSWSTLAVGLELDLAVLSGIAVLFAVAQFRRR